MNVEIHPNDLIKEVNKLLARAKDWSISGELTFIDTTAINAPDDLIFAYEVCGHAFESKT